VEWGLNASGQMAYSFGNDRQPLAFTDPQLCLVICSHCLVICRHGVVSFCQRIPLNNYQDFGWKSQDRSCPAVLSNNITQLSAGIVALGLAGQGQPPSARSLNHQLRRSLGGFFLESRVMEVEEYYRGPRLPDVCAECEDELGLSRSGHQFCTNRLCKDGFDVRPDWRFMLLQQLEQ
jgi:hypothetical protein